LAVWRLRRDLEHFSTRIASERRLSMAVGTSELTRELEELIAALDLRMPRVEQVGEAAIARDAATLRAKDIKRLAELANDPAMRGSNGRRDLR
jgi:hypothetical protein